jgi:transcriptional regulator GlxA family with amidase domain
MRRRDFFRGAAGLGLTHLAARGAAAPGKAPGEPAAPKLTPPASGPIPVAFTISAGVTVIDFAGPWEVFQDVMIPERGGSHENQMPFELFTVSESKQVVTASAGLKIVPDHTFETAPQPRVIVVPAQRGSKALHAWLRAASTRADLTMSVCTGAFQLAKAGLLDGKQATTHHDFTDDLASEFPNVKVQKGLRFVEGGPNLATAGGLTSGIDLALRVVERYFGRTAAERTAFYMEYQSKGWMV